MNSMLLLLHKMELEPNLLHYTLQVQMPMNLCFFETTVNRSFQHFRGELIGIHGRLDQLEVAGPRHP